jgi:hypothetical protein
LFFLLVVLQAPSLLGWSFNNCGDPAKEEYVIHRLLVAPNPIPSSGTITIFFNATAVTSMWARSGKKKFYYPPPPPRHLPPLAKYLHYLRPLLSNHAGFMQTTNKFEQNEM